MDWAKLGLATSQLIIMAFFVTGVVEVAKDLYGQFRTFVNWVANVLRVNKIALGPEDIMLSERAVKLLSFAAGVYMSFGLDYGALSDILSLGENLRANQAAWIDYIATGAVLRLGGGGIFDALTALTGRLQAVKAEAAKLGAT